MTRIRYKQTKQYETGFIYGVQPEGMDYIKIGFCCDRYDRLKTLQVAWPIPLHYVFVLPGPRSLEQAFHSTIWKHRARGDWFHLNHEVRQFIAELLERHPEAKPPAPESEPAKPTCEHFVPIGGFACARCGLSRLLIQ